MTTKKKVNVALTVAGALIAIALAVWAALDDGRLTQEEAADIGGKVTAGIEQVQGALDAPDAETAE